MNRNDFLRLSLILDDNQATTFEKTLSKLVIDILRENFGKKLTVSQIIDRLKECFSLDFSPNEVLLVLRKYSNTFEIEKDAVDSVLDKYTLTISCYEKVKNKKSFNIDGIISKFIQILPNKDDVNNEKIENLILRFLYSIFNDDADRLLQYMNAGKQLGVEDKNEYTIEEKQIIDSFIEWDNNEKNQFLYKVLSSSIDYCMLTTKKDSSIISSLFFNKTFYLDSNIVFRLAGINTRERQLTAESFISKCKEVRIKIKYTNIAENEIDNTINYYVDVLKSILGNKQVISPEAAALMSSSHINTDFYNEYVQWIKDPSHSAGDYSSFKKSLKKKINDTLMNFEFEAISKYDRKYKGFDSLTASLYGYKQKNNRNPSKLSLSTDINHYLFLKEKNQGVAHKSFIDVNNFLITEDRNFVNWITENYPQTVPTVMLSSIWYSVLLKFTSRTADDYNAYVQFIKFNTDDSTQPFDEKRSAILSRVLGLDESSAIKEAVIFDINTNFKTRYKDLEVDEIVNLSHATIIDQKIFAREEELKKEFELTRQQDIMAFTEEQKQIMQDSYQQGKNDLQQDIIDIYCRRIRKRNISLIVLFYIGIASGIIVFSVLLGLNNPTVVKFAEWTNKFGTIFSIIASLVLSILLAVLKKVGLLLTNIDKIKERELKKLEKNK